MHNVPTWRTGEANVLTSKSSNVAYRRTQLFKRLANEVIEPGGRQGRAFPSPIWGYDFRWTYKTYLKTPDDLPRNAQIRLPTPCYFPAIPNARACPGNLALANSIQRERRTAEPPAPY